MGLLDKVFDEIQRGVDKFAFEDTSMKSARRGRMGGSDWLNSFMAGSFSKSTLSGATSAGRNPFSVNKGARAIRSAQEQNEASVYGANLGHQAIGREPGKGPDAPGATDLPPVGTGTRNARQRARQSAIDAARRRFGIGDTVATTPLGLQGDGASLGKKRLTGE